MSTFTLAAVPLRCPTLDGAVGELVSGTPEAAAARRRSTPYRLVNAYSVALADRDESYRALLQGPGTNFPDGSAVAAALRRRAAPAGVEVEQVRGPSLFEATLDRGRAHGVRHYFLGGDEATLARLRERAVEKYPGVQVVGCWSPPFRALTDDERRAQDDALHAARPDLVWVGLGTPKQDYEAARLAEQGFVALGVGAAFDFLAGTKREAPLIFRRLRLEWAFRLMTEPRRLWRRYLFGNTRFIYAVLRDRRPGLAGR